MNVDGNGKVDILDSTNIEARVIAGNSLVTPNRIILSNSSTHEDLAEVFTVFKPSPQTKARIQSTDQNFDINQEGVYIRNIATNEDYTYQQVNDGVAVVMGGKEAVKVYDSGAIKILDNSFSLEMLPSEGQKFLSFKLLNAGQDVAVMTAVAQLSNDVSLLGADFT